MLPSGSNSPNAAHAAGAEVRVINLKVAATVNHKTESPDLLVQAKRKAYQKMRTRKRKTEKRQALSKASIPGATIVVAAAGGFLVGKVARDEREQQQQQQQSDNDDDDDYYTTTASGSVSITMVQDPPLPTPPPPTEEEIKKERLRSQEAAKYVKNALMRQQQQQQQAVTISTVENYDNNNAEEIMTNRESIIATDKTQAYFTDVSAAIAYQEMLLEKVKARIKDSAAADALSAAAIEALANEFDEYEKAFDDTAPPSPTPVAAAIRAEPTESKRDNSNDDDESI